MKKFRIMAVCGMVAAMMLLTSSQALAYTFTIKNETSRPIKATYQWDAQTESHWFNDGNEIAPGQTYSKHFDGVRCIGTFGVNYNGKWHYKTWPGCGNKTFTVTEDIKIST